MKIQDIINRLKDTRGFLNDCKDSNSQEDCTDEEVDYMLEGIEEAIKLIQDLGSK